MTLSPEQINPLYGQVAQLIIEAVGRGHEETEKFHKAFDQAKAYSTLCEFIKGIEPPEKGYHNFREQILNFISNQEGGE